MADVFKRTKDRSGTHYDTVPHPSCHDAEHCDCECSGCLLDWKRARTPGPKTFVIPWWAARGLASADAIEGARDA